MGFPAELLTGRFDRALIAELFLEFPLSFVGLASVAEVGYPSVDIGITTPTLGVFIPTAGQSCCVDFD